MNSEQLEEHMMILAIQAAHHASSSQVKLKDSTVSDDSESDVDSRLDGDRGSESPRVKISAHMFLLGMHRNIFFVSISPFSYYFHACCSHWCPFYNL